MPDYKSVFEDAAGSVAIVYRKSLNSVAPMAPNEVQRNPASWQRPQENGVDVPDKYLKWNGPADHVEVMTAQEKADEDAAEAAAAALALDAGVDWSNWKGLFGPVAVYTFKQVNILRVASGMAPLTKAIVKAGIKGEL